MLTVTNLAVRIDGRPVVAGASLDVQRGETVALVGPNGAGKSTVGRAIAGLCPTQSGQIEITTRGGIVRIDALPPWRRFRCGIQFFPAERCVFLSLSVRDNLRVCRATSRSTGGFEDHWKTTLVRFPMLADKLGQSAATLSGGEQRLLAMARAHLAVLVAGPTNSVVILDEPTHGLAPVALEAIADSIRWFQTVTAAVLVIEQNRAFARRVASRMFTMNRGTIVANSSLDLLPSTTDESKAN